VREEEERENEYGDKRMRNASRGKSPVTASPGVLAHVK
jgi:hypothetical protein